MKTHRPISGFLSGPAAGMNPPPASSRLSGAHSGAAAALRHAAGALYSQMYHWGRDVRHPSGNLLLKYGLTRIAKTTVTGTSRYQGLWGNGTVELHGFYAGWHCGNGGGVLFHRQRHAWFLLDGLREPECDGRVSIPGFRPAAAEELPVLLEAVSTFFQWLHAYAEWSAGQWDPREKQRQYRDYLRLRPRRWWLPPEDSLRWLSLFARDPLTAPAPKALLREKEGLRPGPAVCPVRPAGTAGRGSFRPKARSAPASRPASD